MELIEKYNLSSLTNSEKRSLILNILYTLELNDYEETEEEVKIKKKSEKKKDLSQNVLKIKRSEK